MTRMRNLGARARSATLMAALTFTLSACGGGGGSSSTAVDSASSGGSGSGGTPSPSPGPDTQAPVISSHTPTEDATGVAVTAAIEVQFDETLAAASVNADSIILSLNAVPLAGDVSYDAASRLLRFEPRDELVPDTVYSVEVATTLADSAGNLFLGATWFFTTGDGFNLGATTQTTIDQCMQDSDKQMLTLVNNSRASATTCGADTLAAVPALSWHCLLEDAAQDHSESMADNDFHEHISPIDGSNPGDRIAATGYTARAWGENIAAGYADTETVVQAWLDSEGHCRNIMSASFTQMGSGVAENPASTYRIYWTQKFAAPR